MFVHLWTPLARDSALIAAWIEARVPASVPRWGWAILLVLAALVIGRIGGRLLAGLVQLALLLAAVLVAWQMIRTPGPSPAAPAACVLEGTCAAGAPIQPASGTAAPAGRVDASPGAASVPLSAGR